MTYYKASTFNGNIVTGYGETLCDARDDARSKAAELGSVIRKKIGHGEAVALYAEGKRAYTFRFPA
jgi:hypothetical protein